MNASSAVPLARLSNVASGGAVASSGAADTSSSPSEIALYQQWCEQSKFKLEESFKLNLRKRLIQCCDTVNARVSSCGIDDKFVLTVDDVKRFADGVKYEILSWNGVDMGTCTKEKRTFTEYHKTAQNWFNRNKAKIYGNHVFYPLVFGHILNFCNDTKFPSPLAVDHNRRMHLFVTILISILESKIKFHRTKKQPLLTQQTLMQPNKFKSTLLEFFAHFELDFDTALVSFTHLNRKVKNDKQRSQKATDLYMEKLVAILGRMQQKADEQQQCTLFVPSGVQSAAAAQQQAPPPMMIPKVTIPTHDVDVDVDMSEHMHTTTTTTTPMTEEVKSPSSPMTSAGFKTEEEHSQNHDSDNGNHQQALQTAVSAPQPPFPPPHVQRHPLAPDDVLHSITVPVNDRCSVVYQFMSFDPMVINERIVFHFS